MKRASQKIGDALHEPNSSRREAYLVGLAALGAVSAFAYLRIARLSLQFDFHAPLEPRPIIGVLLLFGLAFACYLVAIWLVKTLPSDRRTWALILGGALLFRVMLLTSTPIQEIDIYRYVWDGAVASRGISPFQYSPQQVKEAHVDDPSLPADLHTLAVLRDQNPAVAEALHHVHHSHVPTVYPPTSQALFATVHLATPSSASLETRLIVMKSWFVAFDIATIGLVVWLLHMAGQPKTLCIVYAWCPLVMKEFANSGHLDALAVMLTTLALACTLNACCDFKSKSTNAVAPPAQRFAWASAVLVILALAIGAKLYPIILAPLIIWLLTRGLVRDWGVIRGLLLTVGWVVGFAALTAFILSPMAPTSSRSTTVTTADSTNTEIPPLPPLDSPSYEPQDPSRGIDVFLRHWEMNDFLFLIVVENLKPNESMPPGEVAWFSILPSAARTAIVEPLQAIFNLHAEQAPFLTTRGLTGGVFLMLAFWFAYCGGSAKSPAEFLQYAFLTIAWFWLLSPTQNPWYWTWALPLLPFARARVWLLVGGLVLVYYLRFWLKIHWPEHTVLGTPYVGYQFFDFVVTWIEFAPFFVLLAGGSLIRTFGGAKPKV